MKITLPQIRLFAIITSFVVVSFTAGWFVRDRGIVDISGKPTISIDRAFLPAGRQDLNFNLFWQVWDTLEQSYYDKSKLDQESMVYGAIKGMVAAVGDPYTAFLPPDEQKRTQEDLGGEFEGVGIQIGFKGSRLAVVAPLPGSPAEAKGVQAGDFIVGILDPAKNVDMGTAGITLIDAVEVIRGKAGTPVTLVLTREGVDNPFEVEITRAKIEVPSVKVEFIGEGSQIAHLSLLRFGGNTNGEWDRAIRQLVDKKPRGLILDLRNNPGGYLQGSVDVTSEFLKSGIVVIQEDGGGGRKTSNVSGSAGLADIPMVVLVNGGSASASEIVAAALSENNRATIIGETTFGKGTIQEAKPINGNSGIHITTARWLTPKDNWIDQVGVKPDVEVKDDPETEIDEQLAKAVETL